MSRFSKWLDARGQERAVARFEHYKTGERVCVLGELQLVDELSASTKTLLRYSSERTGREYAQTPQDFFADVMRSTPTLFRKVPRFRPLNALAEEMRKKHFSPAEKPRWKPAPGTFFRIGADGAQDICPEEYDRKD